MGFYVIIGEKKSIEIGMNIRENIIEPLEKRAMLFFAIINELPRIQIELLKLYLTN